MKWFQKRKKEVKVAIVLPEKTRTMVFSTGDKLTVTVDVDINVPGFKGVITVPVVLEIKEII